MMLTTAVRLVVELRAGSQRKLDLLRQCLIV